jgi:hypothetical protein
MIEKILFYGLITVFVGITLNWANSKANEKLKPDYEEKVHLKMNKLYFFGGVSSFVMWVLFSIFLFSEANNDIINFLLRFGIISLVTLGPGIPCLLWYLNHSVYYDKEKIYVQNIYGQKRVIFIKDIKSSNLNLMTGLLAVNTDNETVKIHQHLVGVGELTKKIKNVA